jgi:hypothetical protein
MASLSEVANPHAQLPVVRGFGTRKSSPRANVAPSALSTSRRPTCLGHLHSPRVVVSGLATRAEPGASIRGTVVFVCSAIQRCVAQPRRRSIGFPSDDSSDQRVHVSLYAKRYRIVNPLEPVFLRAARWRSRDHHPFRTGDKPNWIAAVLCPRIRKSSSRAQPETNAVSAERAVLILISFQIFPKSSSRPFRARRR